MIHVMTPLDMSLKGRFRRTVVPDDIVVSKWVDLSAGQIGRIQMKQLVLTVTVPERHLQRRRPIRARLPLD